jgi:hypothetical protein
MSRRPFRLEHMNRNSFNRTRWMVWIAAAILALGLLDYALRKHGARNETSANRGSEKKSTLSAVVFNDYQPPTKDTLPSSLKISPETVMALVNGRALAAADVLPPGSFNDPISLHAYKYFLQRAIDRELILQTAKAQGVALDGSQRQQMLDFETTREQHGPGLVRDLNGGADEVSFEMRDTEAFMLQASLMEKSGASPNVTAQQVLSYYQQHAAEFGELPADELARQEVWNNIDYQIRQTLANSVRSTFQTKLADYMKRLQAGANIQMTPLASLAGPGQ